jgi:predicted RND superfamily exporter protein
MRSFFALVLRHRVLVVLCCAAATALAVFGASKLFVASSFAKLFFGDLEEYRAYQRLARRFGSDEVFFVGYEDPAPLSADSLRRLREVTRRLKSQRDVARVESLLTAQRIRSVEDTLTIDRYAEAAGDPAAAMEALRRDELVSGLLIGRGGRHAAVLVELTIDPDRPAERLPELVRRSIACFRDAGYRAERLHYAGLPALMSEMLAQTHVNLRRLLPITLVVLLGVGLLLFRRLAPSLLALGVAALAVAWSLGFARLLDRELNIFVSVVPAVVLIVSFSDVIHLWSAFRLELAGGKTREQAILASASDVGTACLLTSATTFLGFVCLAAVPTPVFRQLGLVLGFGVAVALLLAMTLVPVVLSLIKPPRVERRDAGARPVMDRALGRVAGIVTAHPWAVIAGSGVVVVAACLGLRSLNVEADLAQRFHTKNPYRVDQRYFNRNFSGTNTLQVFVDSERERGLLEPGVLARVARLQRRLERLPEVDRTLSLVTLLEAMHEALGGQGPLPEDRRALAQYLLLFEMSGGEDLDRFVDFKRSAMQVALRLNDHGVRATNKVGQEAERLGRLLLPEVQVKASGIVQLVGWWLDAILAGQRRGLGLSVVLIALMMVVGLRSLRVGLGAMVANLLPVLVLAGYLGATEPRVDFDVMVIAMMALGIGVDDTIHFLVRHRLESRRSQNPAQALRSTYAFSGRAIVLTTVVLVLGFLPFALSDYYSTRIMGTLLPGVLVVALLADLVLLPALIRVGWLAPSRTGVASAAHVDQ